MHVAVCIVGFRNTPDIVRCVAALEASTHPDFEVVICENGGPRAHAALVAALPSPLSGGQPLRVVLAPGNLGYPAGINVCLSQSPTADAWWVLNPDTEAEPRAMAALVERLASGACDAVGGVLIRPDQTIQSYGGIWRGWLARSVSIGFGGSPAETPEAARIESAQNYLSGASMMIGRRFRDVAGPMREDLFIYCEEVEWCVRAARRGIRLGFAPGARVLHFHGTSTGSGHGAQARARLPIYLDERNKIVVTRLHFPFRLPVAAAAALALLFARYGAKGAWKQLAWGIDGWWDGIRDRRGPPPFLVS